jgi:hypothetical protein
MRISIIVELPDLTPSDRAASKIMDELEAAVRPALDHIGHYWWLDMEGGETRYAPEGDWLDSMCPPAKNRTPESDNA